VGPVSGWLNSFRPAASNRRVEQNREGAMNQFDQSQATAEAALRSYFQGELPPRWPDAPSPLTPAHPDHRRERSRPLTISRWALAASLALLVGGAAWLGSAFRAVDKPVKLE